MEIILVIGFILLIVFIISRPTKKTSIQRLNKPKEIPKSQLIITDEFKEILDLLKNSTKNLFITGKAGTGKL
jgi:hypothetical protein